MTIEGRKSSQQPQIQAVEPMARAAEGIVELIRGQTTRTTADPNESVISSIRDFENFVIIIERILRIFTYFV